MKKVLIALCLIGLIALVGCGSYVETEPESVCDIDVEDCDQEPVDTQEATSNTEIIIEEPPEV